jgi:hypothetical protein
MGRDRPFLAGLSTLQSVADTLRDHRIAASSWIEAPEILLHLGDSLGEPVEYKRRIGRFLLWRAGPSVGEARYLAVDPDSGEVVTFDLHGKDGVGLGPDGSRHTRFRAWKESLLGRAQT